MFSTKHNNMFAFSFSKVLRYYEFLAIILERCKNAGTEFHATLNALQTSFKDREGALSTEQSRLLENNSHSTLILHLEIESFYLFAKILLDKAARALEFYFGKAQRSPLDSHDDLTKNIKKYAAARNISIPGEELLEIVGRLKNDVSDYRDQEIAHEKSPRSMKGTASDAKGTARITTLRIYPTEKDKQVESKPPEEVLKQIDEYLRLLIIYIGSNRDKTALSQVTETKTNR